MKYQGILLFGIYLTGIVIAILTALLMKNIAFSGKGVPFVMELPPYRIPTLRNTLLHMWHKGQQYLKKMGSVILIASVIIWALGYYPRNAELSADYAAKIQAVEDQDEIEEHEKEILIKELEYAYDFERQEKSYIGMIGHCVEPIIRPLGFDWKMGVSLMTGLAAKEIVISTMGVLYQSGQVMMRECKIFEAKDQRTNTVPESWKDNRFYAPCEHWFYVVHIDIFPLRCSYCGYQKRGKLGLGNIYDALYNRPGLVDFVFGLSDRKHDLLKNDDSLC